MRRAAAVAVAFVAALAVAQVPMYSDYPWGLLNNGVDKGPVWNLNCKPPLVCSVPSYGNGQIVLGDGGTFGGLTLDDLPDGILYGRTRFGSLDAGYVTQVQRGGVAYDLSSFFAFPLDTLDKVPEGVTFGRTARGDLDGGHVAILLRQGLSTPTEQLFQKATALTPDTLDGVPDGTLTGRVAKGNIDGGAVVLDLTLEGTYGRVARSKLDGGSIVLDLTLDGTFAKVLTSALDAGYVTQVRRSGTAVATEYLFKKANTTDADTLDGVPDGTSYSRISTANVTSSAPNSVYHSGSGAVISAGTLFRKSTDTFASVAGTLADGQLGSNVVNTSNIKDSNITTIKIADGNVTTAKVADLGITYAKVDDGLSMTAYDEAPGLYLWTRATATNCTKVALDGTKGYITFNLPSGATNPQVSTTITTGTNLTLTTTRAVMRYRISGAGVVGKISSITAINNAATAQTATAVFLADGNWHTAVFDISGWTTAGTLRVDLTSPGTSTTGTWDISYLGTGNPGSGTGALVSYVNKVGIGTPTPATLLSLLPTLSYAAPSLGTASGSFSMLGPAGLFGLYGGIASGGQAWLQSMRNDGTATAYDIWLNPSGGNVGIGTTPSYRLHVVGGAGKVSVDSQAAGTSSSYGLYVGNATTNTKNLGLGYDTTLDRGYLQAVDVGTAYKDLLLNPNGGSVGIGTTAPGVTLDVQATASTTARVVSTSAASAAYPALATYAYTGGLGGHPVLYHYAARGSQASPAALATNDTLGALIWNGADATAAPVFREGARISVIEAATPSAGALTTVMAFYTANNGASTERARIDNAGNLKVSNLAGSGNRAVYSDANGNLTNTSSDGTLKERVMELVAPLRAVLNLRPVSFNWKDTERFGPQREIGFIAQEVMGVVPEVVGKNADGTYTVDYPKLTAVLAGSVRELYEDRTALAERVQALEDRSAAAERQLADLKERLARLEAR